MRSELLRSYFAFWTVLGLLIAVGAFALHELADLPGGALAGAANLPTLEVRHYLP